MLTYALSHYEIWFLVLLRMVGFIGASPLFSLRIWPTWGKIGLAVFLSILVVPSLHSAVPSVTTDPGNYIVAGLKESMVGILMGFIGTLVFSTISIAGSIIDMQIGFGAVQFFDPQGGQMSGITGTLKSALFTLYFLGINGLNGLTFAVMNSYRLAPLGQFHLPGGFWQFMTEILAAVMTLAVQMVAPVIAGLFLTDVTFALLSRAVPQMNVFVVGLPAKLLVGLALLGVAMPVMVYVYGEVSSLMFTQVNNALQLLGG